jgi:hypothetical protein
LGVRKCRRTSGPVGERRIEPVVSLAELVAGFELLTAEAGDAALKMAMG